MDYGAASRICIGVSLVDATAAFVIPLSHASASSYGHYLLLGMCLSVLWLVMVTLGLVTLGRKVSWALLGLPLAGIWPLLWGLAFVSCRWGHDCL